VPIVAAVFGVAESTAYFDSMMLNAPSGPGGSTVTIVEPAILTDLNAGFPIVSGLLTFR
jgi:hypothetical protein